MRFITGLVFLCVVGLGATADAVGQTNIFGEGTKEEAEKEKERPKPTTQQEGKELLLWAGAWDVPQPKAEWKLVKVGYFRDKAGVEDEYCLGFLEPGTKRVLIGFAFKEMVEKNGEAFRVVEPEKVSLDKVMSEIWSANGWEGVNLGLVTGIQLVRAGHEKLGMELIDKARGVDVGHPHGAFYSRAGEPVVLMLARSCLAARVNEITSVKPDFVKIKERIEKLAADQPDLKVKETDWLLKSLQANVTHVPGKPGTVERMVDDYVLGGEAGMDEDFTAAERALILKGFAAVPALMAQRESDRFSNHLMHGFNNFPSYPMTAGMVINAYLQRLANDELGSDWLRRQQGFVAEEDAVKAWWKKASAMGEEAYVKQYTVVEEGTDSYRVSSELLLLAQEKYPELLMGFYTKVLKSSKSDYGVLSAILECKSITEKQKIECIEAGIKTNFKGHRNGALYELRQRQPKLADERLLAVLKKAPSTVEKEYWTDQDANLGSLISNSSDLKVWQALSELLDRADLGMRMELINGLYPGQEASAEVLKIFDSIYERYGKDMTVRDEKSSTKFDGPGAGFGYTKITMADFIHLHWGRWLKLAVEEPEREEARPEAWRAFREAVEQEVKRSKEQRK